MLVSAIAFLAIGQTAAPSAPRQPIFPIGCRPELHQLVRQIQEDIAKGDVDGAEKLSNDLPKREFTIGWDESSIPENMKADVDGARDSVVRAWEKIPGVHIKVAPTGDVNISFAKNLPKDDAGLPVESQLTFGANPRLKVEIGLVRGTPEQSIIPTDAYMEIAHAVGAYLGNADDTLPGNCMYRTNLPAVRTYGVTQGNLEIAARNIFACDAVRDLVKLKQPLDLANSQSTISPTKVEMGAVRQGLKVPLDFVVKNSGKGPLIYNLVPDCGCFSRIPSGRLAPGAQITLRTLVNTAVYVGEVRKKLVLYTNDPEHPTQDIPVVFTANPPYRLYRPEGDTVILPIAKNTIDILFTVPKGSNVKPGQYSWSGGTDKVTMEPWSGNVADPDLGEPSKPREGYVFHIKLGPSPSGRMVKTLTVVTDDDALPQADYSVNTQTGIVSLPEELSLGEMTRVTRGTFLVSRPGKPFKILGVESSSKCLHPTVTPNKAGDEYHVDVHYDGSGGIGDFFSQIVIQTNDPTQPKIQVAVRGIVL